MILSIIVPVYNEEKILLKSLKNLKNSKSAVEREIIVINDGSTDGSAKVLEENKELYNKLLINEKNMGKGYSIKKGLIEANGTHIIFHDADLEYDP